MKHSNKAQDDRGSAEPYVTPLLIVTGDAIIETVYDRIPFVNAEIKPSMVQNRPKIRRNSYSEKSLASFDLIRSLFSRLYYSLYSNDEKQRSLCSLSGWRRGISSVFYPFLVPVLSMEILPAGQFCISEIFSMDDSETDAMSEYSDYDNVRLNHRTPNAADEDHLMGPFPVSKSALPYNSIEVEEVSDHIKLSASSHTKELNESIKNTSSIRLVITQVDVAHMTQLHAHNLLNLPVMKFQKSHKEMIEDEVNGWSWIAVSKDPDETDNYEDPIMNRPDENICIICREIFADGDYIQVLPCSHCVHTGCTRLIPRKGLCGSARCPICGKLLLNDDGNIGQPDSSVSDGSVPAWAFARIGRAL